MMSRVIPVGLVVQDQLDFYSLNGQRNPNYNAGLLEVAVFANNEWRAWPITDGSSVQDTQVEAGIVYFNAISGAAGYYALRFFPDRIGYWRIVVRDSVLGQEQILQYDVIPTISLSGMTGITVESVPLGSVTC